MTNRDIVTLAKAGFEENFVIDIVRSSQKRFDTSVDALADLSQQGISQRVIQAMMTPAQPVAAAEAAVATTPDSTSSHLSSEPRDYLGTATLTGTAVCGAVPYYELRSSLWGLWRKEVVASSVHHPGSRTGVQLPASYFYTQYPRYSLPVGVYQAVQQPQLSPALTHGVLPR